jgi:hypothetical protein
LCITLHLNVLCLFSSVLTVGSFINRPKGTNTYGQRKQKIHIWISLFKKKFEKILSSKVLKNFLFHFQIRISPFLSTIIVILGMDKKHPRHYQVLESVQNYLKFIGLQELNIEFRT